MSLGQVHERQEDRAGGGQAVWSRHGEELGLQSADQGSSGTPPIRGACYILSI